MLSCGFETDIKPNAKGTARRMTGSQYLLESKLIKLGKSKFIKFSFVYILSMSVTLTGGQNDGKAFHYQYLLPLQLMPNQ